MTIATDCEYILSMHLGAYSSNFLDRQCRAHLKKTPQELSKQDLDQLANWCYIGLKLAVDEVAAEDAKRSILALKK